MCGITGLWRKNGRDPEDGMRIERMADSIVHRGPDDFGYLLADASSGKTQIGKRLSADFTPDLLLAARRLAITDLSPAGAQPIANEDNTVFIVFNGAIHNFIELRAELIARGHRFRSHTDTEVIVHAYEEWGVDCVRRFNGMWAFALWDARRRELILSRDRFGIKPLYIAETSGAFYFASEIKAILASNEIPLRPRLSTLARYLRRRFPAEGIDTAFEGVEALPAGHNLVVSHDRVTRSRYWDYKEQSQNYDYVRPEETFRELLSDATRIRLRADVPVALLLSGGMDSTAIGGELSRHQPGAGIAFSAVFPGFSSDESAYARAAADHYGLHLRTVNYDASHLLDELKALAWHMELPPPLTQMLVRWQLLQAVANDVPVVLEGQGADELFGGYMAHLRASRRAERRLNAPSNRPSTFAAARSFLSARRRKRNAPPKLPNIFSRKLPREDASRAHLPDLNFSHELNDTLAADHAYNTLPFLLHMSDGIGMAHSVETRLPFLDHRLVEFMFALPAEQKIRNGQSKYILRSALASQMPPAILRRTDKIGFATPVYEKLAQHEAAAIRMLRGAAKSREVFDMVRLEKFLSAYQPNVTAASLLYRALIVESWFQVFVDGSRPARPAAARLRYARYESAG